MNKEDIRVIPKKNYFILALIIGVSLLLVYYFYMWYDAYKETKLNIPIMDTYMEVINYNELDDYLIENPNTIIYVSVLENNTIREFEKRFKRALKNNEFDNEMLYLDITDDLANSKIRGEMINKYTIGNVNITKVPVIMVFENGSLTSIYSISNNGYDMELLKLFVNDINFDKEDELNG